MTASPLDAHPLVAAVAGVHAELDRMPLGGWSGLEASEVRRLTAEIGRAEARLAAQKLAAARALEASGAAKRAGATSTGNLLARDFGGDEYASRQLVKTAEKLEKTSHTQDALARGEVSLTQSDIIATGMAKLPETVTADQRDRAERRLLRDAKNLTVRDLRRRTDRVMDSFAPKAVVDAHENSLLVDRERFARQNATFRMWDKHNGMHGFAGEIPSAEVVMLKTALDALAAPSRAHLTDSDATLGPVPEDHGDPAKRNGRAFTDLCSHLPIDGLPSNGGVGAQTVVTLDCDTLVGGIAPATLSDGTRLSAGQARKLACRTGIIPMVLDGTSLPTDYGQEKRYFTRHQRLALAKRDGGCTAPGCDRPPEWTEAHHLTPYSVGGKTDLKDGALLCTNDHHRVHDQHWQHRVAPDGHIEWKLPGQPWARNQRWRP